MKNANSKTPFAKKSFGQNFLVDQNYILKIMDALDLNKNDTVIEIGPGRGALTEKLIEFAGSVIAIELERDMIEILRERFRSAENFTLIAQDALQIDFVGIAKAQSKGGALAKLVANLPYYISTAILQRLIEQRQIFSEMVLMFQREVVERITAAPGTSERGFLTVLVESAFNVEKLFDIPPTAFRPAPKVWSSVIRLTPKPKAVVDEALFREIISAAFAQKRKTILNNLKSKFPNASAILAAADIEPSRRAETLTLNEWQLLTNTFGAGRKIMPR